METNSSHLWVLESFGQMRRQLNVIFYRRLRPLSIGPKQAILLRQLHKTQPASLAELSRTTQTNPAATGRAVDGLIKKGCILQIDHPTDRRRWKLSLSEKGLVMAKEIDNIASDIACVLCQPLDALERTELARLMTKMASHLPEL
jgi:DNA-binding MarR family transcriptional regulator